MKNKWVQVGVLAVLGIVILVVGVLMGGGVKDFASAFETADPGSSYQSIDEVDMSLVTDLEINIFRGGVSISQENQEIYDYAGSNANVCYVKDGTKLVVGYGADFKKVLNNDVKDLEFTSEQFAQVVGSGTVYLKIPNDTHFNSVTINSKYSSIDIDKIDTDKLTINNTKGEVNIGKAQISSQAIVENNGGNVNIGGNEEEINVIYGLNAKATGGMINVSAQLMGTCEIESMKGVGLILNGAKANYTIDTSVKYAESNESGDGSTDSKGIIKIRSKDDKVSISYK
ncbi:MAG: DUF4097 family beta strand repeat-containing protein [Lachnospiraceae bacterium]|nr:DUF4097 family beta strand repeat-containing protein [Lachnospiraceae bacterium]